MAENRRHDCEMTRIRKLTDQTARAGEEAIEKQRVVEYEQKRDRDGARPPVLPPLRFDENPNTSPADARGRP